jgi:hypothetical protein
MACLGMGCTFIPTAASGGHQSDANSKGQASRKSQCDEDEEFLEKRSKPWVYRGTRQSGEYAEIQRSRGDRGIELLTQLSKFRSAADITPPDCVPKPANLPPSVLANICVSDEHLASLRDALNNIQAQKLNLGLGTGGSRRTSNDNASPGVYLNSDTVMNDCGGNLTLYCRLGLDLHFKFVE